MNDFLKWTDKWLMGVKLLDDQHRMLADCLNRLVMECSCADITEDQDKIKQKETLAGLMEELYLKTKEHFRTEETMMHKEAYPGLPNHAREHIMLLGELKSTFAAKIRDGCCDMNPDILRALKSWYIAHIFSSDQEFSRYLLEKKTANINSKISKGSD